MVKCRRSPSVWIAMGLAAALALSACGRKRSETTEDRVVTAYKLIDADRDEEAIILIESEMKSVKPGTPEHNRLTVVLASAYAHRAGIRVQRFVKALDAGKHKIKFDRPLRIGNEKGLSKSESADLFLYNLSAMIVNVSKMSEQYASIPTIKTGDEKFLDFSMRLLDSIDDRQISQADALYRVVIKVIYLKHFIATRVFTTSVVPNVEVAKCTIDVDKTSQAVKQIGVHLIEIFGDLGRAQPKKAEDYQKQSLKVSLAVANLTEALSSASLLDELAKGLAKQTLVQNGLQNLLKCTSNGVSVSSPGLPSLSGLGLPDSPGL